MAALGCRTGGLHCGERSDLPAVSRSPRISLESKASSRAGGTSSGQCRHAATMKGCAAAALTALLLLAAALPSIEATGASNCCEI